MDSLGMDSGENYFVEWKEQFVSKERGKRVVHYFLKDNAGESVLAVVGTERSLRHMFYVVSEEFLTAYGAENSVHAGFRWRSRREVVNWLTSMLSKQQHKSKSPGDDTNAREDSERILMPDHEGRYSRSLRGRQTDIMWSGVPWSCSKQLTHYPAFSRNGVSIAIHSFVYVMAEKENRYVAYLEDMYEDKKCQKKVKVRWFHHNREVRGVVCLRNSHPKEVFITPHAQVISAECVDGPAVVLTHEHYEKCSTILPDDLLGRMQFCFRQFKSHRLKPFKLCRLRGYYDQPIFSYFNPDFFKLEEVTSGDEVKVGEKRARSSSEHHLSEKEPLFQKLRYDIFDKRLNFQKHVGEYNLKSSPFKVNDKIEFLCQDSGIRGCWFKCTILEVSRRHLKIQYEDLKDEDGFSSLEEWIPACRLASPDKHGTRCSGRPTIRPVRPCEQDGQAIISGTHVDVWWCDGWWEGIVVGGISISDSEGFQVYCPGENLLLHVTKSNMRVSRDWVGDRWVDIDMNPDLVAVVSATISMDDKQSISSIKDSNCHDSPCTCHGIHTSSKLSIVEEETHEQADEEENEECMKDVAVVYATMSMDDKQSISSIKESNCHGSPFTYHGIHSNSKLSIVEEETHEQADEEENEVCMKDMTSVGSEHQQNQNEEDEKDEDTKGEEVKLDHQLTCHNAKSIESLSDGDDNKDDDFENGDSSRGSGEDLMIKDETCEGSTAANHEEVHEIGEGSTAANHEEVHETGEGSTAAKHEEVHETGEGSTAANHEEVHESGEGSTAANHEELHESGEGSTAANHEEVHETGEGSTAANHEEVHETAEGSTVVNHEEVVV